MAAKFEIPVDGFLRKVECLFLQRLSLPYIGMGVMSKVKNGLVIVLKFL